MQKKSNKVKTDSESYSAGAELEGKVKRNKEVKVGNKESSICQAKAKR